jgi:hypothetical protein
VRGFVKMKKRGNIIPESLAGIIILIIVLVILVIGAILLKDKLIGAVKYAATLFRYK